MDQLHVDSFHMIDVHIQYDDRRPTRDACYVSKIARVRVRHLLGVCTGGPLDGWLGGWVGRWLAGWLGQRARRRGYFYMILNLCNHDETMFYEQSPDRHVAADYCWQAYMCEESALTRSVCFFERTLPHTRLPAFSVVSITTAAMVRLVLVSVLLLGLVAMATASPRSGPHAASNQSTHIVVCR